MSEPLWLGSSLPNPEEWGLMRAELDRARQDPEQLERLLEELVADIAGRPHAVAFASSGAALEASLEVLGATRGTEVVLPALGPASLGNAIARSGVRALYADVDARTISLRGTAAAARISPSTRLLVTHLTHGQPTGLQELASLASRYEIPLLEFVGGGLGGRLGRDPVGRFGRVAVVSLGARESAVGSGGAVCVTNDDSLARALRLVRNLGRPEPEQDWERLGGIRTIVRTGLDARIGALNAALGVVRLSRFDEICTALEERFHAYLRRLALHPDLVLPEPCADGTVRWSHFAVRLGERFTRDDRDQIVLGLLRHDIAAARLMHALPLEPGFATGHARGDFPVAERAADRLIALPFSTSLRERDIDLVCQTLQVMIERASIMRS